MSDVPGLEQALGNRKASWWLVPRSTVKMVQRKHAAIERNGKFQESRKGLRKPSVDALFHL